jgi:hypothetical protein
MTPKPSLTVVPTSTESKPYNPASGRKRLAALRRQLLRAAVRYVEDAAEGTRGDRLRTASDLSGVPLVLIDSETRG